MTDTEKIYTPTDNEDTLQFIRRVVSEQTDSEPLHIVEQLVEIVIDELKGRPSDAFAHVSAKHMKVTLRHSGSPIDERTVRLMNDHTDLVDYHPDGDSNNWILIIRRDIPPLYVARR